MNRQLREEVPACRVMSVHARPSAQQAFIPLRRQQHRRADGKQEEGQNESGQNERRRRRRWRRRRERASHATCLCVVQVELVSLHAQPPEQRLVPLPCRLGALLPQEAADAQLLQMRVVSAGRVPRRLGKVQQLNQPLPPTHGGTCCGSEQGWARTGFCGACSSHEETKCACRQSQAEVGR